MLARGPLGVAVRVARGHVMDVERACGLQQVGCCRRGGGQFLQKAARNVLEDELGKQLQRLLGPPQ